MFSRRILGRFIFASLPWLLATGVVIVGGCARSKYRQAADAEAYCLIQTRESDARWDLPARRVEPKSESRMSLVVHQDCGPKPLDDPAAKRFMDFPDCIDNTRYYGQIGTKANTENPIWIDYLPRNEDGQVPLTQPLAIDLGLLHSRDYQTQFENVYLNALSLSGNRFEFETQWFGGVGGGFNATGSDLGDARLLGLSDRLGFSRNLAGGGQFATELLNGLTWNFGAGGAQAGSAALVTTFSQPLLRGAFRHVRLEDLTQAERNLLYSVRDFARFRRLFYVGITESYLSLLTQAQAIRNTRANVENLKQNLTEHEFYADLKIVSQVQVDQVFQQYQNGRLTLLSAEQDLIASQDNFKFALGLPPWLQLKVDESLLEPFELVDPALAELQTKSQVLFEELVQYLPPEQAPLNVLQSNYRQYAELRSQVAEFLPQVEAELEQWQGNLTNIDTSRFTDDDRLDFEQQEFLATRIGERLTELGESLAELESYNASVELAISNYEVEPPKQEAGDDIQSLIETLDSLKDLDDLRIEDILADESDSTAIIAWKALEDAVGRQLREEIAELYVAQTQIRLFLISIEPQSIPSETAVTFAHQNRLDLMNSKALVVDAFRRVEVAADSLESELNVTGGVALGSDANSNSPFSFDSANNQYNLGVQFDGPLNRLNERNAYRARQIEYQRVSRDFLADKDQVANEVRAVLRQLELRRLNFQIARQQVVAATRQVDQAQIALRRSSEADANLTLILLQALQGMLDAKNNLIFNWIQYRVQKMRLFTALDMLYLDENGRWLNEESGLDELARFRAIDPEYFPPSLVGFATDSLASESRETESRERVSSSDPDTLPVESDPSAVPPSEPGAAGFDLQGELVAPAPELDLDGNGGN